MTHCHKCDVELGPHPVIHFYTCLFRTKIRRVCVGCMHWHNLWDHWLI